MRPRDYAGDYESGSGDPVSASPYLLVADVAERLHCSTRTIHGMTSAREIPHRRLPGQRRCLFLAADLERWEGSCPLEVVELPRADASSGRRG
jgi:excisionase family DNA binding protein